MIRLEKKDYPKVIDALKKIKINNLFARAVVEAHVSGSVYVDNSDKPRTFYVVHPYGMSLLFGNHNNLEFNSAFKEYALNKKRQRNDYEWMQAFPKEWDHVLEKLFDDCSITSSENKTNLTKSVIELNTRVNFKFNPNKYSLIRERLNSNDVTIVQTTRETFNTMQGSVVPSNFWDSADDFFEKGVGFSLFSNDTLACTAYSAAVMDDMLELGMETIPKFRGKGFAQLTCSRLIDYCLAQGYEPVWACRLENRGSFRLAEKLGFEPTIQIPYYRLSN
ncbi:MAG: GNAT family N-acetyltransferase [Saonia sp.]